ncbi:MAG: tRNA epoxyqueuosine(34) reductase QueG [Thermoanaerobaculales bacterium]|nr:tRNA epoxyqueuosine(34) reductase QueG [Thermoanaerobaculales bacterium]
MHGLTDELKKRALEEGFDLVGVAHTGPSETAPSLRRWLDDGMHGEMAYMERTAEVRADPGLLLENCRSVLAVAMSYRTDHPESGCDPGDNRVWISRYAWGRDYHRLMKKRLIRLGRWLEEHAPGCSWRACVDTAPALEREWAARAGLGWIGKSTMLLNRHLGSEIFLGLLLTDLDLIADEPTTSHCGRCTACLDACPTSAFTQPGVLDARRCIAYLTVEHRGPIEDELQSLLGHHVAGCDICNEVCPFTRRAPAGLHPEFEPASHRLRPTLEELERLDEDGWKAWRRGSPLGRIPFDALRRTLKIARQNLTRRSRNH